VLKAIEEGRLRCVSTAILLGEIRYVYLREDKPGFEIARAAIEVETNVTLVKRHGIVGHSCRRVEKKVLFEEDRHFIQ
jgi:hypothetical protein